MTATISKQETPQPCTRCIKKHYAKLPRALPHAQTPVAPDTCARAPRQVGTTKGTGGDIIILEEAAYVDQGFFYETMAPLMTIDRTCFLAISTLTSEINFYTRLMRMRDRDTGLPIFTCLQIQLACDKCKDEGKAAECIHLLHLVPRWQSGERHRRLK